jgi:hypothetical protein
MKKPLTFALAAVLLVESGCGALVFHNPESVVVTCNVPNATVSASGESASCLAPGTLALDRTRDHVIRVNAPGYESQTVRIDSHPSWWRIAFSIVLNGGHGIFTFFVSTAIGVGIDVVAGAWQVLDTDEVYVELHRDSFEAPSLSGVRRGEVSPLAPDLGEPPQGAPAPLPPDAHPPSEQKAAPKEACPNCGSHIREGDRFCANCGERL